MASYRIEWKRSAEKELQKLPKEAIDPIVAAVESLKQNPFPHGSRKLAGSKASYRIREGVYRIVYTVAAELLVIEIVRVGHRKDVYR
jgi:mRNA interferase RelE/StbE